jgi:hypothetical protein
MLCTTLISVNDCPVADLAEILAVVVHVPQQPDVTAKP